MKCPLSEVEFFAASLRGKRGSEKSLQPLPLLRLVDAHAHGLQTQTYITQALPYHRAPDKTFATKGT